MKVQKVSNQGEPAPQTPPPELPESFEVEVLEEDYAKTTGQYRMRGYCVMDAAIERTLTGMGFKDPIVKTGFEYATVFVGAKQRPYNLGELGRRAREAYDDEQAKVMGKTTLTSSVKKNTAPGRPR